VLLDAEEQQAGCGVGRPDLRQKREKIVEERRGRGGGATVPFTGARPPIPGSGETHSWVSPDPGDQTVWVLPAGAFWSFSVGLFAVFVSL
jgi:hypothetical protein